MKAPTASGAGFLPATGGRSFGATSPGEAEVTAAAGVLSAKLRSPEYGLESQEGRRLRLRRPPVNGSRPGRPGQHRAGRRQGQGRLQGLTGGLCKEPIPLFRFAVPPKIPAMVSNAPRLE
jgi:hypothetical protein